MGKAIASALLLLLTSIPALATPCLVTTLDKYIENKECFLEDKLFAGWAYGIALGGGATPIQPRNITVTPIDTRFNPGFRFDAPWNVVNEQFVTSEIRFGVLRNPFSFEDDFGKIKDNTLSIANHAVTGDGTVIVEELKCIAMNFDDNFRNLCEDESAPLTLKVDATSPNAHTDFPPENFVAVALKITVDAGIHGTSSLQSVEVRFSETQPVMVPEPPSAVLFVLGGAAVGIIRRLRRPTSSP
jgi:hypothetical protein